MPAFLLTWNPNNWPKTPADIAIRNHLIAETAAGRTAQEDWNTGRIKQVKEGHRVYLVGTASVGGVVGSGIVVKELGDRPRFDDPTKLVNVVMVSWDVFLDAPQAMPMSVEDWHDFDAHPPFKQSGQNYIEDVRRFEKRWKEHLVRIKYHSARVGLSRQPDPELRVKVERAAVAEVTSYFRDRGYAVESYERDNVGWDLLATKGSELLRLEVKGLAGDRLCVELTPNEYENMKRWQDSYYVCVVTDALATPQLAIFRYRDGAWQDDKQRVLVIEERVAARCSLAT